MAARPQRRDWVDELGRIEEAITELIVADGFPPAAGPGPGDGVRSGHSRGGHRPGAVEPRSAGRARQASIALGVVTLDEVKVGRTYGVAAMARRKAAEMPFRAKVVDKLGHKDWRKRRVKVPHLEGKLAGLEQRVTSSHVLAPWSEVRRSPGTSSGGSAWRSRGRTSTAWWRRRSTSYCSPRARTTCTPRTTVPSPYPQRGA